MATAGLVPKSSRMGEIGCRGRRSEETAKKRCLGFRVGIRDELSGWESPFLGEGNIGGSNGIVPVGSPRIWLEPRCLGQPVDVSVVGLH